VVIRLEAIIKTQKRCNVWFLVATAFIASAPVQINIGHFGFVIRDGTHVVIGNVVLNRRHNDGNQQVAARDFDL
jgi:hypothetical protein